MDVFKCECGKQFSWAKGVDLCKAGNHGGLTHNLKAQAEPVTEVPCSVGLCLMLKKLKEEVKEHVRSSELDDEEELCLVSQELIVGRIDTFFEDKIYDIEKKA